MLVPFVHLIPSSLILQALLLIKFLYPKQAQNRLVTFYAKNGVLKKLSTLVELVLMLPMNIQVNMKSPVGKRFVKDGKNFFT